MRYFLEFCKFEKLKIIRFFLSIIHGRVKSASEHQIIFTKLHEKEEQTENEKYRSNMRNIKHNFFFREYEAPILVNQTSQNEKPLHVKYFLIN